VSDRLTVEVGTRSFLAAALRVGAPAMTMKVRTSFKSRGCSFIFTPFDAMASIPRCNLATQDCAIGTDESKKAGVAR
jgi:hypothetical protein